VAVEGVEVALAASGSAAGALAALGDPGAPLLGELEGSRVPRGARVLLIGPASRGNLAVLRRRLPWLVPRPLGLGTSAGLGDRLGLATAGHIQALRDVGGGLRPVLAQQSIREMQRSGRSPQDVVDDAAWGVFAEGWREGYGADADHVKTPEDIDACVPCGYSWFTFDPGAFVQDFAEAAPPGALRDAADALPWEALQDRWSDLRRRYLARPLAVEGGAIEFDEPALLRAAVKYGRAVAHLAALYRHLSSRAARAGRAPSAAPEVEVSVDETEFPTSHAEHAYLAGEMRRLGMAWTAFAPRYVGRFEKGVDYIGDLEAFGRDFARHAAIARRFGPYKLSLHSGSDKFAVYDAAVRESRGLVHLKTAGTSYLEALGTVSRVDPALFREVYALARARYEADRASYHVSGRLDRAPAPGAPSDRDLPSLLAQPDARQILHVTFGSVLSRPALRDRLLRVLAAHREAYEAAVRAHFRRHLAPFARAPGGA
jgi:hypothetical protein